MKSPKPIVAGALAATGLLFATGAAAAVVLPDEAADTARTAVADVTTGRSEHQADASARRAAASDRGERDETEKTTEAADALATEVDETDGDGGADDGQRPTDTHGYTVSSFATSDEAKALEGRERGEAIAAVARQNAGAPRAERAGEAGSEGADDADAAGEATDHGARGRATAAERRGR